MFSRDVMLSSRRHLNPETENRSISVALLFLASYCHLLKSGSYSRRQQRTMFVTYESGASVNLILVRGNPGLTVIWMLCQQYLCIWNLTMLGQGGGSSFSEKLEVNQQ